MSDSIRGYSASYVTVDEMSYYSNGSGSAWMNTTADLKEEITKLGMEIALLRSVILSDPELSREYNKLLMIKELKGEDDEQR